MESHQPGANPVPDPTRAGPGSTGELFRNKPASLLTLSDAFEAGFRVLTKWSFVWPVMVVSVLVNAAAEVAVAPLLPSILNFNRLSPAELERLVVGGLLVFGITVVGGFVGSVYACVWAVVATSGPVATSNDVLRLAARRLLAIVGTGIAVVLISLAVVLPGVGALALGAALHPMLGIAAALVMSGILLWVGARISMAIWLAADGHAVTRSIAGSWRMTKGQLLRVLGWSFLYGIVAGLITGALGTILGILPYTGGGVAQAIGVAITTGAGVTLYRRVQAAAESGTQPSS